ncbi:MAG: protease modulator HflC [Legionellales bacterium RIFCSPHIGHO2_12_FULL_35_11]|nr:MAG: protease modulator HflC [Legionellales bacterium RIFCSPHIGHO2_12_FULL_35_11]
MNAGKKAILWTVGFILFIFFTTCAFTISQGQHGILLRLGKLVHGASADEVLVLNPGFHLKLPFIESAKIFDTRIQTLDIKSSRIVTKEKKDVMVDYYVKWRIENIATYFKATSGNEFKAETLLEQQLNTLLRAQFGKRTISDVVTGGRDDVMGVLREKAEIQAAKLGVHVVDVRIKGIELPANTSNAIYQRMRADMQKIANRHRADGHANAEAIQAAADARAVVVLATANSEAKIIKAKGKAEAANIYANAYGQNKDFFTFYSSLNAYVNSFTSKNDMLILDQTSHFFNYFNHGVTGKPNSLS